MNQAIYRDQNIINLRASCTCVLHGQTTQKMQYFIKSAFACYVTTEMKQNDCEKWPRLLVYIRFIHEMCVKVRLRLTSHNNNTAVLLKACSTPFSTPASMNNNDTQILLTTPKSPLSSTFISGIPLITSRRVRGSRGVCITHLRSQ